MRGVKLYSYRYVCGDREVIAEYLTDHSARVVKHLKRVEGSPLSRYAVMKGRVGEEAFLNTLLTAGALHDVGKAFYQSSESVDSRGCRYISFVGHEWISAYFILRLSREVSGRVSPVASLLDVVFYAILLHHHAMDTRDRARKSASRLNPPSKRELVDGLSELSDLIPDDAVREAYLDLLEGIVGSVLDDVSKGLVNVLESVRGEYLNQLKRSVGIKGRRVLYLLATSALVTADYLAAGEVRGPSSSRFWGVVWDFSEAYFSLGVTH